MRCSVSKCAELLPPSGSLKKHQSTENISLPYPCRNQIALTSNCVFGIFVKARSHLTLKAQAQEKRLLFSQIYAFGLCYYRKRGQHISRINKIHQYCCTSPSHLTKQWLIATKYNLTLI